jgi:hypothetical protein
MVRDVGNLIDVVREKARPHERISFTIDGDGTVKGMLLVPSETRPTEYDLKFVTANVSFDDAVFALAEYLTVRS